MKRNDLNILSTQALEPKGWPVDLESLDIGGPSGGDVWYQVALGTSDSVSDPDPTRWGVTGVKLVSRFAYGI